MFCISASCLAGHFWMYNSVIPRTNTENEGRQQHFKSRITGHYNSVHKFILMWSNTLSFVGCYVQNLLPHTCPSDTGKWTQCCHYFPAFSQGCHFPGAAWALLTSDTSHGMVALRSGRSGTWRECPCFCKLNTSRKPSSQPRAASLNRAGGITGQGGY